MPSIWSDPANILNAAIAIGTLGTFAVAGIGVFLAKRGSDAWRKQLLEKSKHDAARALLKAVYLLKLSVDQGRSRWSIGRKTEEADAEAEPGSQWWMKRRHEEIVMLENRHKSVFEALGEVKVAREDARPVLGHVVVDAVEQLLKVVSELGAAAIALNMFLGFARSDRRYDDEASEQRRLLYDLGSKDEPDDYGARLAAAVTVAENALKPYVG